MSPLFWAFAALVFLFGFVVVFRLGAPYVPSRRFYIDKVFRELYPLSSKDLLVDVGSGDGIVLRRAVRYGAKAVGYELNPLLVIMSNLLSNKTTTHFANFWPAQLPAETTVVYVFMVEAMAKRMEKKLQAEATRLNKVLTVIAYGIPIKGRVPQKTMDAYFLYRFEPLQPQ